jgi:hypothetical protein
VCDHQEVVVQVAAVFGDLDPIVLRLDDLDRGEDHLDVGGDEVPLRLHHVVLAVDAKRDEEEARLVVMRLVLIHDRDLPFILIEQPVEPVDHHGAGRAGAENEEFLHSSEFSL